QRDRDPKFNNTWKSGGVSTIQGYGSNSTYGKYLVRQRVDPGKWHTMGVEWTPGKLVYTIDDQVWGTVQSNYVPNISMGLALQTQAGTTSSNWNPIPNNSTPSMVQMQVDWVVIYAWNPQQTS
ncbi:unnamed protein product, partial [Rotaria sp. Silwood1]